MIVVNNLALINQLLLSEERCDRCQVGADDRVPLSSLATGDARRSLSPPKTAYVVNAHSRPTAIHGGPASASAVRQMSPGQR